MSDANGNDASGWEGRDDEGEKISRFSIHSLVIDNNPTGDGELYKARKRRKLLLSVQFQLYIERGNIYY